jgi:two-component system OmpR family response regulator
MTPAQLREPVLSLIASRSAAGDGFRRAVSRKEGREGAMPHILVVDDDLPICELLACALGDEGWDVRACTHPDDALALAREWAADAIVLDLKLTGMDAASFLDAYRRQVNLRTPVILVSGVTDLAGHAARLGADGMVAKPFDLDTLCETVRRTLTDNFVSSGVRHGC